MSKNIPDVLNGEKHTEMYEGEKYYISIFPGEVFFSTKREKHDNVSSNLNTISRFVSMALQTNTVKAVIEQLDKSLRNKKDIPGILSRLIREDLL